MRLNIRKLLIGWSTALGLLLVPGLGYAVTVSLVQPETGQDSASIVQGSTPTFHFDLRLDTEGNPVSGFQYAILVDGPQPVTYGSTPVTALDHPFTSSDIALAPMPGAQVQEDAGGTTVLFKSSPGDYPPFTDLIVREEFDVSPLRAGTYEFTPGAEEFANSNMVLNNPDDFENRAFTLTVAPVPESGPLMLVLLTGLGAGSFHFLRRFCLRSGTAGSD